ncbi:hypothetical protein EHS25_001698 [Saitozyma podzolica]|uniref:Transcription factor domain-containing protein n=1 Tax=Saitozyma podzolica TaxID=1890683 RepID=A0A427YFB9_9TREE|nr:hypothetical protein EHS25_001698 [Saitozyma podzolica]
MSPPKAEGTSLLVRASSEQTLQSGMYAGSVGKTTSWPVHVRKTVEDLVRRIDRTQAGNDQDATAVLLGAIASNDATADIQQADEACEAFSEGDSEAVSENTAAYDIEAGNLISSEGLNHLRAQRLTGLGVAELGQAEENSAPGHRVAFDIFVARCLSSTCFLDPEDNSFTLEDVRRRSQLLFWSIIAVGAREAEELKSVFLRAQAKALGLFRETLCGIVPTIWDLRGALIFLRWLGPIRPIGHIVDLAYELELHKSHGSDTPSVDHVRLWIQIACLDLILVTNRPGHLLDQENTLVQAKWLVSRSDAKPRDYRLLVSYEFAHLAHSILAIVASGIDLLSDDGLQKVKEREGAIDEWLRQWEPVCASMSQSSEVYPMLVAMKVNFNTAKLFFNTLPLRGLRSAQDISPMKLHYIQQSVIHARAQLKLCVHEFQPPTINYVGEQVHVTFASAAVFLLKTVRLMPGFFDASGILAQVREIADTLGHVSGRSHAKVLRQMLKRIEDTRQDAPADLGTHARAGVIEDSTQHSSASADLAVDVLFPPDVPPLETTEMSDFWDWDAYDNGSLLQDLSIFEL